MSDKGVGTFCIIFLLVGIMIGVCVEKKKWRDSVIEHGAAEWRCDPVTGSAKFHWKEDQ